LAGLITAVERRVDKRGRPWAICTVEDLDAAVEVLFFASAYAVHSPDLVQDAAVTVTGRTSLRGDTVAVIGEKLARIDLARGSEAPLELTCLPQLLDLDSVTELRQSLIAHPGETPVHVRLECQAGRRYFALDNYPVHVTAALLGELKGVRAIAEVRQPL
jgi:DNA polymerase-3 subunit alpha